MSLNILRYLSIKDFTDSYKDYCMVEPRLTVDVSKFVRRLVYLINNMELDPIEFIKDLFHGTEFGFISKH